MKEAEILSIIRESTIKVAVHLGIAFPELYNNSELNKLIGQNNHVVYESLHRYVQACWKFYFASATVSRAGIANREAKEIELCESQKTTTRKELIELLTLIKI